MLILSRKMQQEIVLPDHQIVIRVLEIKGNRVSLGIEAPKSTKILRAEICDPARADGGEPFDPCAERRPPIFAVPRPREPPTRTA